MEYSIDLPLAIAIIKYKHKKKLNQSYRNIIKYIILPKFETHRRRIENIKPKKPKPTGKSIIPILKSFNISYENVNVEEFIRETRNTRIDLKDRYEVEQLLFILKYLIQWDNSTKNLFLIQYLAGELIHNDFSKYEPVASPEIHRFWHTLFRNLDECILLSICHEERITTTVKYKFIHVESIYNCIFLNHQKLKQRFSYNDLLSEFSLNIAKIVFFKLGKWVSNDKRYLIKILSKIKYNETIKFELINLLINSYNFNPMSSHIKKITHCFKEKIKNPNLLNHLVICYLKLIKSMLIAVDLREDKYFQLKRKLLALLIINNDAESIKFYQINF